MTQTLILLCTLAALVGLPLGYGIGWALEAAAPYARLVWWAVCVLFGMRSMQRELDAVFVLWSDAGYRVEPKLEPEAAS